MLKTCLLYTIYIKIYLWINFKEDEGGSEEDVCPVRMYTLLFFFCIPYLVMFFHTSIYCLFFFTLDCKCSMLMIHIRTSTYCEKV